MNFSDLFVVSALAAAVYAVVVAVAGRRHFLEHAVNPHRGAWLLAAASVAWVGVGLLRWEAKSWEPAEWGRLLTKLVTDEAASPAVKAASLAILLGLVFAALAAWCAAALPVSPGAFRRPADRARAVRYYVTRLRGGLDYALLSRCDGALLEEAVARRQVGRLLDHLPPAAGPGGRPRAADEQVAAWRAAAAEVVRREAELDGAVAPALHGRVRQVVFDTEFGGLFFRFVRLPDPSSPAGAGLYLFAATLSQAEMDNGRAANHFRLLLEALRSIDRGLRTD